MSDGEIGLGDDNGSVGFRAKRIKELMAATMFHARMCHVAARTPRTIAVLRGLPAASAAATGCSSTARRGRALGQQRSSSDHVRRHCGFDRKGINTRHCGSGPSRCAYNHSRYPRSTVSGPWCCRFLGSCQSGSRPISQARVGVFHSRSNRCHIARLILGCGRALGVEPHIREAPSADQSSRGRYLSRPLHGGFDGLPERL
jgi:hypothetical protein